MSDTKERQRQHSRQYRALHPEKVKASRKRWRQENRETVNATHRQWCANNIERTLFMEAKARAKKRGTRFTITLENIPPMGSHCPLLGHPFAPARSGSTLAPSLDQIDATLGYVPGNVWIVGRRANLVKNDGTAEEHEQIARAMRAAAAAKVTP